MPRSKSENPFEAPAEPQRPVQRATCQYCARDLPWLSAKQGVAYGRRHIVGRSVTGGQICNACYEAGREPDYREELSQAFGERHQGDIWGALCSAATDVRSRLDGAELLSQLRSVRIGHG